MRALDFHQSGPISNTGVDATIFIMRDEFIVGSLSSSERFFPGYSDFPFPQKPTFSNFNSTRNQVDEESQSGCGISKNRHVLYLII